MREREIQKRAVLALNRIPNCLAVTYYNGGIYSPSAKSFLKKPRDMFPGVPDILGWIKGIPFAIEMKAPGGRVSEAQTQMHQRLEAVGCHTRVCYSEKECVDFVLSLDRLYLKTHEGEK